MKKDTQLRKVQLTFNNPQDHGLSKEKLIEQCNLLTSVTYMCMCEEISETGTPHIHMYIYSVAPIRFGRLKKVFPTAHIEKAYGSHAENREYITKTGKFANTDKAKTNLPETFYEKGVLPKEKESAEDRKEKLYKMVDSGMTNFEILEEDKTYVYLIKQMDQIRQTILEQKFARVERELEVTFVTGDTGTGKTRDIHKMHGGNMCRITSYQKDGTARFDAYQGEDVLVFEEFAGQITITDMLNYLDRYPVRLPARYQDKVACYTKVYITSNLSIWEIYKKEQIEKPKTYQAFLRRINTIKEYSSDGNIKEYTLNKVEGKGVEDEKKE